MMIALGILLLLYAAASWAWSLAGKQLWLMLWLEFLPPAGQWLVRGALAALGLCLVWRGIRRRSGTGSLPGEAGRSRGRGAAGSVEAALEIDAGSTGRARDGEGAA